CVAMVQRSASDNSAADVPAGLQGIIPAGTLAQARDQLPKWLNWHRTPGLALATVEQDAPGHRLAAGLADARDGTPMTPEHRFPVASLGKPVAACALLRLMVRRRIGLDEPMAHHLPGLPDAERRALAGITVRQLLSHSAGLPDWRR